MHRTHAPGQTRRDVNDSYHTHHTHTTHTTHTHTTHTTHTPHTHHTHHKHTTHTPHTTHTTHTTHTHNTHTHTTHTPTSLPSLIAAPGPPSWWRHEQLSVAALVATPLHHRAHRQEPVVEEAGPRGVPRPLGTDATSPRDAARAVV